MLAGRTKQVASYDALGFFTGEGVFEDGHQLPVPPLLDRFQKKRQIKKDHGACHTFFILIRGVIISEGVIYPKVVFVVHHANENNHP